MIYDYNNGTDHRKWEHTWRRRPFQEETIHYPLMLQYAGYGFIRSEWSVTREPSYLYAIEYVCAGNAILIQDNQKYIINKGEVFLLRKDVKHYYSIGSAGRLVKRFIVIDGSALENILRILNLWGKDHIICKEPAKIEALMKEFTNILTGPQVPDMAPLLSSKIFYLLLILSQSIHESIHPAIKKALDFMHQNLHRSISRNEISLCTGMNISYFSRMFSEHFDCSPFNYFIQQKFKWAAHLLQATDYSIKDIAAIVGIGDPLYFSAQFKKHLGVSPRHFRNKTTLTE